MESNALNNFSLTQAYWQDLEEKANVITHAIGLLLSPIALFALLFASYGNHLHCCSAGLFGLSIILLYLTSTLYHAARCPKKKHLLRICDHCAIYLLIAGTYTPISICVLQEQGWPLLTAIWVIACLGILFKLLFTGRFEHLSTFLYLAMGWLVVIKLDQLLDLMPSNCLYLLFSGGMAYSVGAAVYLMRSLLFHHALWHLFVLAGTSLHFFAIFYFL